MSVRPDVLPHPSARLSGADGVLVSVSLSVDPRLLESLLETLAEASFPINPQLFHDASVERVYPDGRADIEPVTIVEFPAYAGRVGEIRRLVSERGFDPGSVWFRSMLEELHSEDISQPAPPGTPWVRIVRHRYSTPPS
jgi:hypothetical protein